ncbi:MAG: DNA polymerase III delta prime subunit [Alteromonas naphthalenivorans]|jgi:DNA polymerase III delta prime subunit
MVQPAPAQLFIVPRTQTQTIVYNYLQTIFCEHNTCGTCTTCQLIKNKQHHSILWIEPEKRYTLDLLDGISKKTDFSLESNQKYFFILTKADFLTPACANSLLKIVEEPPPGYHFIFVAQRKQMVLGTIRSRCVIQSFGTEHATQEAFAFGTHFMSFNIDPNAFLKELSSTQITEVESIELLDLFLDYWCTHHKKAVASQNQNATVRTQSMINLFEKGLQKPPMPGSSKIFWRNLFLQKSLV